MAVPLARQGLPTILYGTEIEQRKALARRVRCMDAPNSLGLWLAKPLYMDFEKVRFGEVAEWLNAAVLKTVDRLRGPGVRIPPSPPD